MKISEVMTPDVEVIRPDDTLRTAAQMMADLDAGVLPVCDGEHLVGMVTDRDITVRGVAAGCSPEDTQVHDVMSDELRYCFEDDDVEMISKQMARWHVRRLPVLDRDKRLVGIVSLGDLAIGGAEDESKEALREISKAPSTEAKA
jgi:CBS domain-containing protein